MTPEQTEAYLAVLRAAGALKDTLRNSWTGGGRRESAAEHSWRLCLMAVLLEEQLEGIDVARLLRLLVIHDLGEAVGGDVPAPLQVGDKSAAERADLIAILAPLPPAVRERLVALWDEYDRAESPEARVAKGIDRLETCLGHLEGANPAGFDYRFNLGYGRAWTDSRPALAALRAVVDAETARRAKGEDTGAD
jgi:putative hydrolases of HD superfamily